MKTFFFFLCSALSFHMWVVGFSLDSNPPVEANFTNEPTLILNSENAFDELPNNFRICQNAWSLRLFFSFTSRIGLDKLKASGSAQFSKNGLDKIIQKLPSNKIVIVDLRQESHGFINGTAISWYGPHNAANIGKSVKEIEKDERDRLADVMKQKNIHIYRIITKPQGIIEKTTSIPIKVENTSTEEKLVRDFGLRYIRIPVTDHLPPTEESVEQFLTVVQNLEPNTWLHFHCAAGKGRTTTFLAMYDMLYNAKEVSFEDIIQRQYLIGGKDLTQMPDVKKWKYPHFAARINFLKEFYEKCRQ